MKLKPGLSNRMRKISKEIRAYIILEHQRSIAARGGSAKTPAKVAASRANIGAINARRKAGTEKATTSTL